MATKKIPAVHTPDTQTICRAIARCRSQMSGGAIHFAHLADAIFGREAKVGSATPEGRALDRGLRAARRLGLVTYGAGAIGWCLTTKGLVLATPPAAIP